YDEFSAFAIELENKVYTPIRNHRGDTCILADAQNDAVSTYRYDAFGTFAHTGSIKSPWLLSGQRYDETTKLYHFQNRDYDPFTGRWLTTDPLGFADGPNLYAYVHNNPLIYVDPYGLSEKSLYESTKERIADVWHSPRFQGACQMFTGSAEMGAGATIAYGTAGWAAPVGFSAIAHGADHFSTGLRSFITGRHQETATSQALQKIGLSQSTANLIDNTLGMIATMGGAAATQTFQKTAIQNYKLPPTIKNEVLRDFGYSSTQGALLKQHLKYLEEYGKVSVKLLKNGRYRYYGNCRAARVLGEMKGMRYVHEFNPLTGKSRGWMETLDHNDIIRQVRPQINNQPKVHYMFDKQNKLLEHW
ncbi:MAG TPA: RHS repeat-associated core domain-containing protein, partial [Parachlamydiaceae bacterium]|nr:RHS repeat-associated core domain-containing protein [Parachlamydiaceae bacterium]